MAQELRGFERGIGVLAFLLGSQLSERATSVEVNRVANPNSMPRLPIPYDKLIIAAKSNEQDAKKVTRHLEKIATVLSLRRMSEIRRFQDFRMGCARIYRTEMYVMRGMQASGHNL